jgi:hypothetical protein
MQGLQDKLSEGISVAKDKLGEGMSVFKDKLGESSSVAKDKLDELKLYLEKNPKITDLLIPDYLQDRLVKGVDIIKDKLDQGEDMAKDELGESQYFTENKLKNIKKFMKHSPRMAPIVNIVENHPDMFSNSKAGSLQDKLGEGVSLAKNKLGDIQKYLESNPRIAAMLMAGGGAGLAGGALTAMTPEREEESKGDRRLRILRNALLAGGAGAGVVGLASKGYNKLETALPEGAVHPAEELLTSPTVRTLGGLGGAAAGYAAGQGADANATLLEAISKVRGPKGKKLTKSDLDWLMKDPVNLMREAEAQGIKLNFKTPLEQGINKATTNAKLRANLMKALGSSRAGQYARLAGLAGVFAPEIAGKAYDLVSENI